MNKTSIEWVRTYKPDGAYEAGFTTNPVRFRPKGSRKTVTMCQKASPGCSQCYAENITRRFWPTDALVKFPGYTAGGLETGEFELDDKPLFRILRRKQPTKIFWGDMLDLFLPDIAAEKPEFLDRCFAVATMTPHITHMFLTKHPETLEAYLFPPGQRESRVGRECERLGQELGEDTSKPFWDTFFTWPPPNIMLGCSVENQRWADRRHAPMRNLARQGWHTYVSYEPALGDVIWAGWEFLSLLISGGQSGKGAKPSHPDWHRNARDFCVRNEISYFFKQWGEWGNGSDFAATARMVLIDGSVLSSKKDITPEMEANWHNLSACMMSPAGKHYTGATLDNRVWREFPNLQKDKEVKIEGHFALNRSAIDGSTRHGSATDNTNSSFGTAGRNRS